MTNPKPHTKRLLTAPVALALSLSLTSAALAAPGDTNSLNNGRDITGGTYYNTAANKTTFMNNRGADGLVLPSGQTVRGLEVNGAGNPTGNGGTLHFYAPGSMVRLDGNVDVSGLVNGSGAYIGNGGRVFVDSAMLFQNGTIFANGINGGAVQFNVGSAMFGPGARVEARGFGGLAGTISVNGVGTVDLQNGAIFDASGRSLNTRNQSDNVNVNIVASLVNNNGIIRANAVNVGTDGHIALLGSNATLAAAEATEAGRAVISTPTTPVDSGLSGGVIRLVSNGQTRSDCVDCAADKGVAEGIITTGQASDIKARNASLVANNEGNVVNTNLIQANGGNNTNTNPNTGLDGGAGGKIFISSAADVNNTGLIEAKGGRGANYFDPTNPGQRPGNGGAGGTIGISAQNNITNGSNAVLDASGGNGGDSSTDPASPNGGYNLTLTNTSNVGGTSTPTSQTAVGQLNAETIVRGGIRAGNGGNGGVVALSYGNTMTNDGTVSANGGNGGSGLNVSVDVLADAGVRQTAVSTAIAVAGAGGNGGNGGLVVMSGADNPAGAGVINANGGTGGNGGNANARAGALSIASGNSDFGEDALASSVAFGGQAGLGGLSGTVLTPNPATATFNYSARSGAEGQVGTATAESRGLGVDAGFAQAFAQGNANSTARAIGTTINIVSVNPITDFTPGSAPSNIRQAFQTRNIFNLNAADTNLLAGTFGTIGVGSSESVASPTVNFTQGLLPVVAGPPVGNTPSIDYADALATRNVITSAGPGANTPLGQTQNTEVIVNGDTALILSKGSGNSELLSNRINDAVFSGNARFLNTDEQPLRHMLVSDVSDTSLLALDKPAGGFLDGLTSLTVNTVNDAVIPDGTTWTVGVDPNSGNLSSGGGHASITAAGTVGTLGSGQLLAYGTNTGGSLALTGDNVFISNDSGNSYTNLSTNASGSAFHGGAITLKANGAVWNDPGINEDADTAILANGNALGGTVRLQAGVLLANNGRVEANGGLQGGSIIGKSGLVALNQQSLAANGGNQGGYVRWHGNALAINGPDVPGALNAIGYPGDISATGGITGGVIKLTSGGPVPAEYSNDESIDLTNLLPNQDGFGITQGTLLPGGTANASLLTALPNTLPLGSAINAGNLNTQATGTTDTGAIDIAGDGLAFSTATSTINGITLGTDPVAFFANANAAGTRFIAGPGAVLASVCGGIIPQNPPTLTPDNPTTPTGGLQPQGLQDFTALLFQNQRPYLLDRLPVPTNNKLILRLGSPGLFLARAYAPVTQEILNLALEEYNRELANGRTIQEALRITQLYMEQAGVDSEVASNLVEQIAAGNYSADNRVVSVLQTIAAKNVQPVAPVESGEPLRQ